LGFYSLVLAERTLLIILPTTSQFHHGDLASFDLFFPCQHRASLPRKAAMRWRDEERPATPMSAASITTEISSPAFLPAISAKLGSESRLHHDYFFSRAGMSIAQ